MGPLDGDGRPEVAAGTPGDDGATGSDEGSLVLFSPFVVGDCDGDGIANAYDTCNDVDHDGAGNAIFSTPTCPLDCDDTNPYTYPGALDICDGVGNDCTAPGYPAPPADECFDVDDLTVTQTGSDLLFQWAVPAGGADGYNLYRGVISDLQAGTTGGYCFASSATNSLQVSDPIPLGTITYYVLAGVRGGVEGSRGRDFYGTERTPGDVCH